MRRFVAVYGTFMKEKLKGTLFGTSAQDGNFHLYSLTFRVENSENEDRWT